MKTWLVTRHPGAVDWLSARFDTAHARTVPHLDTNQIEPGDRVVGTLPIQAIAQVWERGGVYYHLSIHLTPETRGRELTAADLDALGAALHCYFAEARPQQDYFPTS